MKYIVLSIVSMAFLLSCTNNSDQADAYGNFEAIEVMVSSEATGKIMELDIQEGQQIKAGEMVGVIDTVQLRFKKEQLDATIDAISSKTKDIQSQIDVLIEQRSNLAREYDRFKRLLKDSAATRKQLDDIEGQINVVDKNIIATKKTLNDANRAILSEQKPIHAQKLALADNLAKSYISSPISGTVLKTYAEHGEIVTFGKPLFKIADMSELTLRVYISGTQLASAKTGDIVTVRVDKGSDEYVRYDGRITWISDKAEFTPKIVQTKEERVNLVYAVKVAVSNDGKLKIGMPGEILFKR